MGSLNSNIFIDPLESNYLDNDKEYHFMSNSDWKIPIYLSNYWDSFSNSWNYLEKDSYMKQDDCFRYRRFGKFEYNNLTGYLKIIKENTFYQSSKINNYAGNIERTFAYLEENTYQNQFLLFIISQAICFFEKNNNVKCRIANITLHQFRIIADNNFIGLPTPEGIHQDGHEFISMHLIKRHNVSGGLSSIYNLEKEKIDEILLEKSMDSLFLNDKKLYHSVSPITNFNKNEQGYRDILVIDYNFKKECEK